jgi:hypothetical protein
VAAAASERFTNGRRIYLTSRKADRNYAVLVRKNHSPPGSIGSMRRRKRKGSTLAEHDALLKAEGRYEEVVA